MRILFVTFEALLGGHVLSALTVADGMRKRGHDVMFAAKRGELTPIIEKKMLFHDINIPIYHGTRQTYFTWKSFSAVWQLKNVVQNNKIELIHAFDARSYILAYIVGLLINIPVTCTLCGGIDPYMNIPVSAKIIVFSEEQKDKMLRKYRWKADRVEIIRTRLDVQQLLANRVQYTNNNIPKLKLNSNAAILMMISSFDSTKIKSVYNVLQAVELLLKRGKKIQMVFIGGQGKHFEEAKSYTSNINIFFDEELIQFTGPVIGAFALLRLSDIVLGVGRSAFEGMLYKKPTLIVGENGFAGTVSPEKIDEIAYYNFSGRNQTTLCPPEILADAIDNVLSNPELQLEFGMFGKNFVLEEIAVNKGLAKIEEVYQINVRKKNLLFKIHQWFSLIKIMIPIWRDNFYHTLSTPIKSLLTYRAIRSKSISPIEGADVNATIQD